MFDRQFLNKDDTKCLYGIAVLLMIIYHTLGNPEHFNDNYVSMFYIREVRIAAFGKICVAMYAFISGFGLYRQMTILKKNNEQETFEKRLKKGYKKVLFQIWGFYKKYWLVFAMFVPIGYIFFDRKFYLAECIKNVLGISKSYNLEWWYVRTYIIMLLIFPIIDAIYEYIFKDRNRKRLMAIVLTFTFIAMIVLEIKFGYLGNILELIRKLYIKITGDWADCLIIFWVGYFVARYNIFDWFYVRMHTKWGKTAIGILGIIGCFIIRTYLTRENAYTRFDIVLTPIFIFSVVILLETNWIGKKLRELFKVFGKYSTYMWLTHTFFAYYYFKNIVLLPRYSILVFVWLVIISLVTAWILERIYQYIGLGIGKIKRVEEK